MPSLLHRSRKIAYTKTGSGTPVVFVHGSFATSSAWRKIVDNLDTARCSAIAVDLPGSGGSDEVSGAPMGLLAFDAETVEAVAKEVAGAPVHLVAHSHGAVIALAIALKGCEWIHSLTLFDPVPMGVLAETTEADTIPKTIAFVAEYRRAYEDGDSWAARRVIDRLGGVGTFEAMAPKLREAVRAGTAQNIGHWESNLAFRPSVEQYKALRVPTTIVRGERSRPTDRLISQTLSQLIPASKLIEIPGASHFMISTHATECASIIGPLSVVRR